VALEHALGLWSCSGEPTDIGTMREKVAAFAARRGVDEQLLDDVRLVVSEAVTNAIVHGLRDRRDGVIVVRAALTATQLLIEVTDDGVGLSPHPEAGGMGAGLDLIRAVTADMRLSSTRDGGTELAVAFPRP
jgi:anti-sigma regulatory factor (Ser/Thr protein kinase)